MRLHQARPLPFLSITDFNKTKAEERPARLNPDRKRKASVIAKDADHRESRAAQRKAFKDQAPAWTPPFSSCQWAQRTSLTRMLMLLTTL